MLDIKSAYNSLGPENQRVIRKLIDVMLEENANAVWIPVSEAASLLSVSAPTVYKKIEEGVIRSRNVGERKTVVLRADILSLIEEA